MKIKELLPIGSVVMLKNAKKPLMIFGIKQMSTETDSEEFDYIGVMYPEGNIGQNFQYLFNHKDIIDVLFTGYETEERQKFLEELEKVY